MLITLVHRYFLRAVANHTVPQAHALNLFTFVQVSVSFQIMVSASFHQRDANRQDDERGLAFSVIVSITDQRCIIPFPHN